MQSTETNINPCCPSIEVLLSGLTEYGQYAHMRLILSKNNNRTLGQTYLMVSRSGFQVVKLIDIEYSENQICMALQDNCTGIIKNVHLDIDDPAFSFLLISMQDIRELLNSESFSSSVGDELLEFDF